MTAMTTRRDAVVRAGRDGFGQLLHSEWTKFRTVRGWVIGMLLAGLLIIAVNFIPGGQCGGMQPNGQISPGGPGCAVTLGPTGQAVTDSFYFVHQPMTANGSITVRADVHDWLHTHRAVLRPTTSACSRGLRQR
jgi:hypothetical protein